MAPYFTDDKNLAATRTSPTTNFPVRRTLPTTKSVAKPLGREGSGFLSKPYFADNFPYIADDKPYITDDKPYIADI
ncbi:hypothetical protein J2Y63_006475 [Shinella sp. BE166]|uniref:hypothetical protein n=1 Tax=Shinella sp. BE166 TaxID=3373918 RepID=UPI003EB6D526